MDQLFSLTDDDIELVLEWRNQPAVRKNMYTQHVIELSEHKAWWQRAKRDENSHYFVYVSDGRKTGFVSITDVNQADGTASWAFFAGPNSPRGTGKRMETLALKMAFEDLGVRKLNCEVLAFNKSVIGLHKRFGFQIEGVRVAHKLLNEEYHDVVQMALFADAWRSTPIIELNQ